VQPVTSDCGLKGVSKAATASVIPVEKRCNRVSSVVYAKKAMPERAGSDCSDLALEVSTKLTAVLKHLVEYAIDQLEELVWVDLDTSVRSLRHLVGGLCIGPFHELEVGIVECTAR